jgi:hypothetical protein
MSLGLQPRGAFTPYIKYDARAGRWFKKADGADVDVTNGFAALFDFEEIQIGWMQFPTGAAPIYCTQHISMGIPPQPQGDFKQGFRMNLALPGALGGGVFELSSTAAALINEIDKLHTEYAQAPEAAQGKLPVVQMNGTTVVESKGRDKNGQTQTSRNYAPNLAIVAWVDRPATMPLKPRTAAVQPAAAQQPQQQQQPAMFQQGQPVQPQGGHAGVSPANGAGGQVNQQQPASFGASTVQDGRQGAYAAPTGAPPQAGFGTAPATGSERVAPPPPPAGGFGQAAPQAPAEPSGAFG